MDQSAVVGKSKWVVLAEELWLGGWHIAELVDHTYWQLSTMESKLGHRHSLNKACQGAVINYVVKEQSLITLRESGH